MDMSSPGCVEEEEERERERQRETERSACIYIVEQERVFFEYINIYAGA